MSSPGVVGVTLYLRQICLVAEQLAPVVRDFSEVFSIGVCHVDPGVGRFGLENALFAVGSKFVEVVAPVRAGTAAGRFLERRGGNGGYMVICQALSRDDQEQVRRNAAGQDVRVAYEADRGDWHIMQLHPGDMGASFLEVEWDSQADPQGNWHPAGGTEWTHAVCTDVVSDITAAELQSHDPDALAARWAAVLDLPVLEHKGVPTIQLANAALRFVVATDGRGDGLGAVDVRTSDRARALAQAQRAGVDTSADRIILCGTRFNLVD